MALILDEMPPSPFPLFQDWFAQAQASIQPMPEAMTLATADEHGKPAARMVLLKGVDSSGFVFYTNYQSAKASQLTSNPRGALVFWWHAIMKQVRAAGPVTRVTADVSDAYFRNRPRDSQLGAWASPQSQVIPDRTLLENRFRQFEERYAGQEVPRPPHWGGFLLAPERVEFWSEQPHRLHDRIVYIRRGSNWEIQRLGP